MVRRMQAAAAVMALILLGAASANESPPSRVPLVQMAGHLPHWTPAQLCARSVNVIQKAYAAGWMSDTPWERQLMLTSLAGDTEGVKAALAENTQHLNATALQAWRNSALANAVWAAREATATALLDSGAEINAPARVPNFKPAVTHAIAKQALGDKTARAFQHAGILADQPSQPVGPPLLTAVQCNDVPMARLLLKRGADADVAPPDRPTRTGYAVITAVVLKEDAMLRLFLDHGLNPCHVTTVEAGTVADLALRVKLPPDLVARLRCMRKAGGS